VIEPIRLIVSRRYPEDCVGAVYVGRPSIFGNPFKVGPNGSIADVIRKYESLFLLSGPSIVRRDALTQLSGKNLACWCAPRGGIAPDADQQLCHAQVIARYVNLAVVLQASVVL